MSRILTLNVAGRWSTSAPKDFLLRNQIPSTEHRRGGDRADRETACSLREREFTVGLENTFVVQFVQIYK